MYLPDFGLCLFRRDIQARDAVIGAEVIIAFDSHVGNALSFMRKRGGHFMPKSRFLAAQLEAYFAGDLWLQNAMHANSVAKALAEALERCRQVKIMHPVEGNEVFAALPDALVEALVAKGFTFYQNWRLDPRHHRFVASWASSLEDVDTLAMVCSQNQ